MQDFSRAVHAAHYALLAQAIPGAIVEFGCFMGNTAKLLTHISDKPVYVYDSFAGLPRKDIVGLRVRDRMDTNGTAPLVANFEADALLLPTIIEKWFDEITPDDLPEQIAFAHIDGDLYSSTLTALGLLYARVSPGGIILVDDCFKTRWAGVKVAVDEFLSDKPESVVELPGCSFEGRDAKGLIVKQ